MLMGKRFGPRVREGICGLCPEIIKMLYNGCVTLAALNDWTLTRDANGPAIFGVGDLRELRFNLRQHRVEAPKLSSSLLARLFRQLPRHLQYSSTSKFQEPHNETAIVIAEFNHRIPP
jgi:hypothetical protein